MSSLSLPGSGNPSTGTSLSASRFPGSSNEQIAATAYQMVREFFPSQVQESDAATKLRIELLADVVREVGAERFTAAVKQALSVSRSRWDCSVSRIRECAGLKYTPAPSAAHDAWIWLTEFIRRHVRLSGEDGVRFEPYVYMVATGTAAEIPIPTIPPPIERAVRGLGGWSSLLRSDPAYWTARMRDFCAVYVEQGSPRMDSSELAR